MVGPEDREYDPSRHGPHFNDGGAGVSFTYMGHLRRLLGTASVWGGIVALLDERERLAARVELLEARLGDICAVVDEARERLA